MSNDRAFVWFGEALEDIWSFHSLFNKGCGCLRAATPCQRVEDVGCGHSPVISIQKDFSCSQTNNAAFSISPGLAEKAQSHLSVM